MENDVVDRGISRTEFSVFRTEMRESLQQLTGLMSQLVQLQADHNNLESRVSRHDRELDNLGKRVLPWNKARAERM
ncbi:hypothetical protein P4S72_27160 [Vibrio sp. PP-XX7]